MPCGKHKYQAMWKKEHKEHPKLPAGVIGQIVKDHMKKRKYK
jgi:hypothetical protein